MNGTKDFMTTQTSESETAPAVDLHRLVRPITCEWDDTKLRHAYPPGDHKVSLCGYDGPSTWKNEATVPVNVCPICAAILPEYWDGSRWIGHNVQGDSTAP